MDETRDSLSNAVAGLYTLARCGPSYAPAGPASSKSQTLTPAVSYDQVRTAGHLRRDRFQFQVEKRVGTPYGTRSYLAVSAPLRKQGLQLRRDCPPLFLRRVGRPPGT